MEFAFIEHYII